MPQPRYSLAVRDIVEGMSRWHMWMRLGWTDVRARYRRTTFGPFWATLSLGIFMVTFSIVWSQLWKMNVADYLPFVSAGMLSWVLVSAIVADGASAFSAQKGLLENMRFPLTVITCAVVWRNMILFLHNFLVYIAIALFFNVPIGWATLLVVPGLLFVCINGVWVATLLGMIGARYRDVQQLIGNFLQIALFLTPIFWNPDQISSTGRASIVLVQFNPLLQFIDIIRNPLLGKMPTLSNWIMVLALTLMGWLFTLAVYARFRHRVPYWL